MSRTTGPILAVGAITVVNRSVFGDEPVDWRIPIATGLTAIGFTLFERLMPDVARILAWGSVAAVLLTRMNSKEPAPVERLLDWWNQGGKTR